jgi:hypothetical protein
MKNISETSLKALEFLHTYQFLTVEQFLRLGLATYKESIRRILKRLRTEKQPCVEKTDYGFVPGYGRLSSIFYLTRWGAEILADYNRSDVSGIRYQKSRRLFQNDYFHRLYTVDYHITLREWVEKENALVDFFDTYFDKTYVGRAGNPARKLHARTRVTLPKGFIVPDIIHGLTLANGNQRMTTVEIHNGRDTKRFLSQMERHAQALEHGAINEKYKRFIPYSVLWIFEHESTMQAAAKRLRQREDWQGFQGHITFNTLKNIREGSGKEKDPFIEK